MGFGNTAEHFETISCFLRHLNIASGIISENPYVDLLYNAVLIWDQLLLEATGITKSTEYVRQLRRTEKKQ